MIRETFNKVAIDKLDDLIYAKVPKPVVLKNGMSIGGGYLRPELNYTLPAMLVKEETLPAVWKNYTEMTTSICDRALELKCPEFMIELESLPPMTVYPKWGGENVKVIRDIMASYEAKHGLKSALRFTPVDMREGKQLKHLWRGPEWDQIMEVMELGCKAGADFLSIESVGGKEVHDEASMYCDIKKAAFALGVLRCTDMEKLWTGIVEIAEKNGKIAAGDSACGFANTAMVLAEQKYIPRVYGAAIRVMAAVSEMVAIECGAKGPHKDCGYEGVYMKAITGTPISTEGRMACHAHLSQVGNIALCLSDNWSNESIQNIKVLSGMAPTAGFEQLVYDCRMMNTARAKGQDVMIRDILADSDSTLDPHAYILRPDVVLEISKEMVKVEGHLARTKAAGLLALEAMKKGHAAGKLNLDPKELEWLDTLRADLEGVTENPDQLTKEMLPECENIRPELYDL